MSATVFSKRTFTDETVQFPIAIANTGVLQAQWVLESGAGTVTSSFFIAQFPGHSPLLVDKTPATNKLWSDTGLTFDQEANDGGGFSSRALPFADVSGETLLWQLVIVGTVELSGHVSVAGANL